MPAPTTEDMLAAAFEEIAALREEIRILQSGQGRTLPGDFRFSTSPDGSEVVIRRVSTGGEQSITGPL